MAKTSSVYTRVEPDIKERAEQVLSELGIPMANAINLFLYHVVLQQGIPCDVKLPRNAPLEYSALTQEQLDAEIGKGFASLEAGKVSSSGQVRERMQRKYGV
jgi:addiction module RelB/DinJ family antitoxin